MIIQATNVNQALPAALLQMQAHGVEGPSRNGPVVYLPAPVMTLYEKPWQRVLFSPLRNANPFFHFMESMWMLAGRNDVEFLAQYNKSIGQFSDDGETFHGAYGYRWWYWRNWNQLPRVIELLRQDPTTRRAVLQMWDADTDLSGGKDLPCNTHIYFDCRDGRLNMTVCNRSNDLFWGCYGANVVHFSFLQQFVAESLGVPMGHYVQVSNNLHVYTDKFPRDKWDAYIEDSKASDFYDKACFSGQKHAFHALLYPPLSPLSSGPSLLAGSPDNARALIDELRRFCDAPWKAHPEQPYRTSWLHNVVIPMQLAWQFRAQYDVAMHWCSEIAASDWAYACAQYLTLKQEKRNVRKSATTA